MMMTLAPRIRRRFYLFCFERGWKTKVFLKMSKKVEMKNFKLAESGTTAHPNKTPFTCSLFAVDKPSDGSPHGADGKLIQISSAVCDQYLSTFDGMGINIDYQEGMSDHDIRFKVGVISKTFRSLDGMAMAEGYIYGKDFPDVVATIRYYNGLALEYEWDDYKFGTSLEMEAKVVTSPIDPNVLDVIEFCGTGAAILFADAAAYRTTSFAAGNKHEEVVNDMTPEQIKAIQDAMTALTSGMANLTASVQTVVGEVGAIKADLESVKAAKVETDKKTVEEAAAAELKAAQDKTAAVEKELADLKAASAPDPQRKTATAAQLLAKHGKVEGSEATTVSEFCASVDKLNLSPIESMALKMKAKKELITKEGV